MMTIFQPFVNSWDSLRSPWEHGVQTRAPKTDLRDVGESYVLEADMPGFQKEEIQLSLEGDVLTITAKHAEETVQDSSAADSADGTAVPVQKKPEKGKYLQRERVVCNYLQRLDTSNVDTAHIDAAYENGVLILTLPKKQPVQPETRQISIS